jgi:phosphohistidine phosphatase
MQRLILFRHAEAEVRAAGQSDHDRPLTAQGRYDAGLMGRVLASAGYAPDRALVSSSVRTRETWEAMASSFPDADAEESRALYNASAAQIAKAVQKAGANGGAVMVVGHVPGVQLLALSLAQTGSTVARQVHEGFPTASAAVIAFDEAGKPSFERLLRVKDFGGQA